MSSTSSRSSSVPVCFAPAPTGNHFHQLTPLSTLMASCQTAVKPANRKLIKLDMNINDPAFAEALVDNFIDILPSG